MGPPSYKRSVVDRNFVMWRMSVYTSVVEHVFAQLGLAQQPINVGPF
jgi:hypothetical protein